MTDASLLGWCAHCEGYLAQGQWNLQESSWSINRLEMRAIILVLQRSCPWLQGKAVQQTDKATTVAYINWQGGTSSMCLEAEAEALLTWAEEHLQALLAAHAAGTDSVTADYLSLVHMDPGEWMLCQEEVLQVVRRWGMPIMDLMVTFATSKVSLFFSRR